MLGTQMPPVRLSAVSSSLAFLADVPRVLVNEPNPGDKTGNATPYGSSFEWKAFLRALGAVLFTKASVSHPPPLLTSYIPVPHAGRQGGVRNAQRKGVCVGVPTCTHMSVHNSPPCLRPCPSHHRYPFLTACVVTQKIDLTHKSAFKGQRKMFLRIIGSILYTYIICIPVVQYIMQIMYDMQTYIHPHNKCKVIHTCITFPWRLCNSYLQNEARKKIILQRDFFHCYLK